MSLGLPCKSGAVKKHRTAKMAGQSVDAIEALEEILGSLSVKIVDGRLHFSLLLYFLFLFLLFSIFYF